jgi:hypothetical protein
MNISFYRKVKYKNDGEYTYQCLHCKNYFSGCHHFTPYYCCYCGVKFKGFILDQQFFCLHYSSPRYIWKIQESEWSWADEGYKPWRDYYNPYTVKEGDAKKVIEKLKDLRERTQAEHNKWIYDCKKFAKMRGEEPKIDLKVNQPSKYRAIRIYQPDNKKSIIVKTKTVYEHTGLFVHDCDIKTDWTQGKGTEVRPEKLFGKKEQDVQVA